MTGIPLVLSLASIIVPFHSIQGRNYYTESVNGLRETLVKEVGAAEAAQIEIPFELTEEMLMKVREQAKYVHDAGEKRRRLLDMIIGGSQIGVVYDPKATRTAREVYEQKIGNCLSLTNLFVGLARSASLDARFVHVTEIERYSESKSASKSGTVIHSSHICAGIDEGSGTILVDFSPMPTRKYHAYRVIDDLTALAHFYNNRAYEVGFFSPDLPPAEREAKEIELYQMAIRVKPDFFPAYNNLGALYRRRGETAKALELYEKALSFNPQFAEAHSNRASIYISQGKPDAAVEELKQAIDTNSANPYIYHDLGQIYYSMGKYREAEDCFRKATSRGDSPVFHLSLARTRLALGRTKDAISALRKAIKIDPQNGEARNLLAMLGETP